MDFASTMFVFERRGRTCGHLKELICVSTGCPEETSPGEHQRQTLECPDEQIDAPYWTRR